MDAAMAQRYGLRAPTPAAPPAAEGSPGAPARTLAMEGIPDVNVASSGTWSREGIKYKLRLKDEKGKETVAEGIMKDDQFLLTSEGQTMIFDRQIVL
jgi:hypothetical protein